MHLFPRSLTVRLFLTIAVVLSVAQLLSAALHFLDRGQVLYHTAGLNSAERIAAIVRLVDRMPVAERAQVVRTLDSLPLHIALQPAGSVAGDAAAAPDERARLIQRMIHSLLGPEYPVQVRLRATSDTLTAFDLSAIHTASSVGRREDPQTQAMVDMMDDLGLLLPQSVSFEARVRLHDGSWVSFDSQLPQAVFAWTHKLIWSLLLLLVSAVVVALVVVRWLTRPLATLAQAAEGLGHDIHRPPLPERGPTEVRRAAHAFNTMQARILRYLEDRLRLMAAVSHDLKTPITRLRLRAEMLEDAELKHKICRDLEEMDTMVRDALNFMRGIEVDEPVQAIDVNALLESLQADAEDLGQTMEIHGQAGTPFRGRPMALKRCITNLLDNAFKYGGRARVHVEDGPERLRLRIADDGPGIPEQELDRVFEPFYRVEHSRSRATGGAGLGLSIARSLARAHGGDVVLRNLAGGGLEAGLTLPRHPHR